MANVKENDGYVRTLPMTSMLRLFNVLQTGDGVNFLNIFRGQTISDAVANTPEIFDFYTVTDGDHLDDISYKIYETEHFWWLIAIVNGYTNPYEAIEEGDTVKFLKKEYIYVLLDDISDLAGL